MRLKFISDLHIEFYTKDPEALLNYCTKPKEKADILLVGGDLGVPFRSPAHKLQYHHAIKHLLSRFPEVCIIPGNHDHYYGSLGEYAEYAKELRREFGEKLHLVDGRDILKVPLTNSKNLWMCTLWFGDQTTVQLVYYGINDSRLISNTWDEISSVGVKQAKELLARVKPGDIILTHHAPTYQDARYTHSGSSLTPLYFNPLGEKIITECEPSYWLFGHCHTESRRICFNTEIISASAGYMGYGSKPPHFFEVGAKPATLEI